jgi:hypothetical protein
LRKNSNFDICLLPDNDTRKIEVSSVRGHQQELNDDVQPGWLCGKRPNDVYVKELRPVYFPTEYVQEYVHVL